MINVLIHGCNGRMGNMVSALSANYEEIHIAAGVDRADTPDGGKSYPIYETLADVKEKADVIIDISTATAMDGLFAYIRETKIPAVICTTGLGKEQEEEIDALSKEVPILRSGNMSMGINTLLKVIKDISKTLTGAGFDVEIVEKHHRTKVDAPSGTAIMLADAVKEGTQEDYDYVYGRNERRSVRPQNEIGISSVRGGTIVGEHEVIFAGTDEVIEIRHTAFSRAVFANGALNAALFLSQQKAGLYSMSDVIG